MRSSVYGSKREIAAKTKRHKGNPKPQKGFGFPQHLRERKRETTAPSNMPNTREREKEGTTNILAYRGQVLKGTKTNLIPTQRQNPK